MGETRRDFLRATAVGLLVIPLAACISSGPVTGGAGYTSQAAERMAALRKEHGLAVLRPDSGLESAALRQAGYMAGTGLMEHKTGRGRDFVSRMSDVKTGGTAAENVAHGRFDTQRVLTVWMNSPPHRRNMLDKRFSRFGLAAVPDPKDPSRLYWAMVLGA